MERSTFDVWTRKQNEMFRELETFQREAKARVEAAFKEGYDAGHSQGASDAHAYECGSGSKRQGTLDKDKSEAWKDSASNTFNAEVSSGGAETKS